MDDVARLLFKMFSLPLASPGSLTVSSPSLALVSLKALVSDILPGVLTTDQMDEIAQLGIQISAVREEAPASLRRMRRVSEIIDSQLTEGASTPSLDKNRLKLIEQGFDFLLTLSHALTSPSIVSIDLRSPQIVPFRYLESLRIDPNPGDPLVSLVGLLPHSLVQSPIPVDLTDDDCSIIRATEIMYYGDRQLPHLNISSRYRWSGGRRWDRPQKPFPDGDLEVFTLMGKRVGWIRTHSIDLPHSINGKHLRLEIPEQPGIVVFETSLFDHDGRLRARSLRLLQASGGDPGF
jgi:hypothetical protein